MPVMTREEFLHRLQRITLLLSGSSSPPVICCINVDRSQIPAVAGTPVPQPSIEHSITTCQGCDASVWIGPTQATMRGVRLCYRCMFVVFKAAPGANWRWKTLNPDADEIPRRG